MRRISAVRITHQELVRMMGLSSEHVVLGMMPASSPVDGYTDFVIEGPLMAAYYYATPVLVETLPDVRRRLV